MRSPMGEANRVPRRAGAYRPASLTRSDAQPGAGVRLIDSRAQRPRTGDAISESILSHFRGLRRQS